MFGGDPRSRRHFDVDRSGMEGKNGVCVRPGRIVAAVPGLEKDKAGLWPRAVSRLSDAVEAYGPDSDRFPAALSHATTAAASMRRS